MEFKLNTYRRVIDLLLCVYRYTLICNFTEYCTASLNHTNGPWKLERQCPVLTVVLSIALCVIFLFCAYVRNLPLTHVYIYICIPVDHPIVDPAMYYGNRSGNVLSLSWQVHWAVPSVMSCALAKGLVLCGINRNTTSIGFMIYILRNT